MNQLDFYVNMMPTILQTPRRADGGAKTYLRYPGGKSRALGVLGRYVRHNWDEYRESMVGGGSMFLYMRRMYPDRQYWINDIYTNLYLFWRECRDNNDVLVDTLLKMKADTTRETSGELFAEVKRTINEQDDITRAAYFYYLNKCSFSGLTESGTCSPQAWVQNFSQSAIESLYDLQYLLAGVKITNLDYREVFGADGENVFIYADPPYDIGENNMLYGRNGETHRNFDHELFADETGKCRHSLMISYNDSPKLRERFVNMRVETIHLKYTMRILEKGKDRKSEIVVLNYE